MKIAACLASRGRPAAMIGVTMSLHRLRSAQHEIDFVLGLDDDDTKVQAHLGAFEGEFAGPDIVFSIAAAPMVRGGVENNMLAAARKAAPDVVTLVTDRTFNITPAWDEWIQRAVTASPNRVLWWQCPEDPGCVIPIIPKAYLDATDWKWSPEIFPFWWDDTWHQEIDLLIHGFPSIKARCTYSGARGKTRNGREFAFWLDVFIKTRQLRIRAAVNIAAALGIGLAKDPRVAEYMTRYDQQLAGRCEEFEKTFGDPGDPGANYLAAKAAAEKLIFLEIKP